MNHFHVEPIPQRESTPDKRRLALLKKLGDKAEFLPQSPATVAIYGSIGAGKSSLLYSWMKNLFPRFYDELIVFCGSADSKEAFESLPQKNILFLTEYDEEAFSEYVEQLKADQLERMENGKPPLNIAIIMDDVIFTDAIAKGGRQGSMVQRLMLIARHELNSTVIIACQHSKQITAPMRNNCMYHIICNVQRNDLTKLAEEHANQLSHDQFIKMYYDVHKKGKHQFLFIDYKAPMDKRFRHNFDQYIDQSKYNNEMMLMSAAAPPAEESAKE